MDMLIRETLRVAQPHAAMRRNLGPEMHIDGKVIPTGTLVMYPFADVHLNSVLYPDPWRFDPTRPHLEADFAYVGFGGGKSLLVSLVAKLTKASLFAACVVSGTVTCLGSRTARLMMKLVTAQLLMDFDFDTVDSSGRIADSQPEPDWNDDLTCRPVHGQFFLKYKSLNFPSGLRSPGSAHPL